MQAVIDPRSGVISTVMSVGFDDAGRVLVAYVKYDAAGLTQLYLARHDAAGRWAVVQARNQAKNRLGNRLSHSLTCWQGLEFLPNARTRLCDPYSHTPTCTARYPTARCDSQRAAWAGSNISWRSAHPTGATVSWSLSCSTDRQEFSSCSCAAAYRLCDPSMIAGEYHLPTLLHRPCHALPQKLAGISSGGDSRAVVDLPGDASAVEHRQWAGLWWRRWRPRAGRGAPALVGDAEPDQRQAPTNGPGPNDAGGDHV